MINFAENLNKMITAGLGGGMEAPRTEVAVGYRSVYLDASGPVVDVETNIVAPLKRLLVTMEPKQEGSGDPSPENIRPITGYNSVTVTHKGKNLLDLSAGTKGTIQPEGTRTFLIGTSGLVPAPDGSFILSAGQYTFASYGFRFNSLRIFSSNPPVAITSSDGYKHTFTIQQSGSYALYFSISPEDFVSWDDVKVMLVKGASAGEYVPYQAEDVTIELGQTVYGGTLDSITGTLTINKAMVDLGTLNWNYASSSRLNFRTVNDVGARPPLNQNDIPDALCSIYPVLDYASLVQGVDAVTIVFAGSTSAGRIWAHNSSYTDVESFRNAVSGQSLVYELAEPLTITLTPAQITTLLGLNRIWSDAGDVEVSYLYYEETEGY